MLCEKCNKRHATVHLTKIINGNKIEQNLCSECAAGYDMSLSFDDIFKNVFNLNMNGFGGMFEEPYSLKYCDNCGLTLEELNRTGKLGCAKCCDAFRDYIDPALKNIHSGTIHKGKRPGKANIIENRKGETIEKPEKVKAVDKKAELERELKEAIKEENYEKAAEIRDILKSMKRED